MKRGLKGMLDYLLAGAVVAIAATYLAFHFFSHRRKPSCAKCGTAQQH